jgi:uncharacterized glyoxalase superfamily protein PhnB
MTEDLEGLMSFVCGDVFGGTDRHRATGAAGRTHVEVEVGDSLVMIGAGSPGGGRTAMLHVYLDDAGAAYRRALEAGATSAMDEHETDFGDRCYAVDDPWGNQWWVSTRQ